MLEEKARVRARPRRLRKSEQVRALARETSLEPSKLVSPIFVTEGSGIVEPIESMPGIYRYAVDTLADYVAKLRDVGVHSTLLFGITGSKDEVGSEAYSSNGVVPRAVAEIKGQFPDEVVIADVCLCEYTSHGHCGVLHGAHVDNDRTIPLLARAAVEYAKAGADIVAPSAMMDGQVAAIRNALDSEGLEDTMIMGYSAKYASAFYGPFREAAGSSPLFGDRLTYQMDPPNSREAMKELAIDVKEGADILMVKPALAYLDVVSRARSRFDLPIAAYNVSGEYVMLKAAAAQGWIDERKATLELLTSIRRAGADFIITYSAEQAASWLAERAF